MNKNNGRNKLIFFLLAIAFIFPFVNAVNIGVSPAVINFNEVMRNGYAERMIVISVDSESPIGIAIEPRGEIVNWLNFSELNFSVSRNSPKYLKVSINPPIDTPNGNYSGFIRIMTESTGEDIDGHAVGKIRSSLDLAVHVTITDTEIIDCVVSNVQISSVEEGDDLVLKMNILNKGNIRLRPQVLFNIWDYDQTRILDEQDFFSKEILPTTSGEVQFRINSKVLDVGQYWSELSVVECIYNSLLTFDILEEGVLSAKGLLLSILTKPEAKIKETVPIEVNFKNVGEKEVSAQFKGTISRDGRIVQVLESEIALVSLDEIQSFHLYFVPERSGKHVISGRVYYNGKKTFESTAVLEVTGGINLMPVIYVLLIVAIMFLFYNIRKERRKFNMKLKHLK